MRPNAVAHPGPTTSALLYWVGWLWLTLFGWRTEGEPPQHAKAVLIATPHTSNWDLPHMLAAAFVFRLRVSWLGKHTLFRPPIGWIMRLLGGVPMDRTGPHGFVEQAASVLRGADRLIVAVPPSGTRSKAEQWKSGFYWIAHSAGVPVVCGYLDYSRRVACLGESFVPSGDVAADMEHVRGIYEGVRGKFPALETPIRLKEERLLEDREAGEAGEAGEPVSEHAEDPGDP